MLLSFFEALTKTTITQIEIFLVLIFRYVLCIFAGQQIQKNNLFCHQQRLTAPESHFPS